MSTIILTTWILIFMNITLHVALTPEELQSQLNEAIADKNTHSYTIPPDDYHFNNTHFDISNAIDFEIISTKTTFYFNFTYGISINNCVNFKISNINIDFNPACFSQGVINSVNETEPSITITIDDGYILPDKSINELFTAGTKVLYWNQTTRDLVYPLQSDHNSWCGSKALTKSAPYKYKICLQSMNTVPKVGWLVTLSPQRGDAITVMNTSNMQFTNMTLYGSCAMAVYEQFGDGNNIYDNYQLRRSPNVNNGRNLLVSNKDAFHSYSVRYAPTLNNSYLSFAADDFINVHNRMNIILQRIKDNTIYAIDTLNGDTFEKIVVDNNDDNKMSFYQLNSMKFIQNSVITSIKKMNNETLTQEAKDAYTEMNKPPYNAPKWLTNWQNSVSVYMITFEDKLNKNVSKYQLIEYDLNQEAKIINNHFHSTFSTLMKMKSKKSIVRNNIFEYGNGMHIVPEQQWLEGELGLNNIIIDNNIFVGCGNQEECITISDTSHNITLSNNTFNN